MNLINIIQGALINIKANKVRVFLTMIGIIIGISSVVVILAIGDGVKAYFAETTSELGGNKIEVSFYPNNYDDLATIKPITDDDILMIEEIKGVSKAEINKDFYGESSSDSSPTYLSGSASIFGQSTSIFAEAYENYPEPELAAGRYFESSDVLNDVIVITYQNALSLFSSPEEAIGVAIDINSTMYEIIGVQAKPASIFDWSYDLVQQASLDRTPVTLVDETEFAPRSTYIYIENGFDYDAVISEVIKSLEEAHEGINGSYESWNPGDMVKEMNEMISAITLFIAFISAISLLVGGIGVMNIMYVSVTERRREIGIRRAIGATPNSILLQFLFEAMFVTLIGGIIGILTGFVLSQIVGLFLPFTPILSLSAFVGASSTSIIIGIIFGIVPARKAANLEPIKAIYN